MNNFCPQVCGQIAAKPAKYRVYPRFYRVPPVDNTVDNVDNLLLRIVDKCVHRCGQLCAQLCTTLVYPQINEQITGMNFETGSAYIIALQAETARFEAAVIDM